MDLTNIEILLSQNNGFLELLASDMNQKTAEIVTALETNQTELLELITTSLEPLVAQNELLLRLYVGQLFVIGVTGAFLVLFLLYKFVRSFY